MLTIEGRMTSQGQITVPAAVRRFLGVEPGERLTFVIEDDGVRLEAVKHTIESIAGTVPQIPGMSLDLDDEIEEAWSDEADRRLGIRRER
jgi:AbrB family looped-hinge helix DNA binding protein